MTETKYCECCGAKMVEYKENLNKGLCNGLLKLYKSEGIGQVSTLGLTHNEACNFNKLRYFGLIEKVDTNLEKGGTWKITEKGKRFVEGSAAVSKQVTTYRGETVARSDEKINMKDVIGSYDYRPWYAMNARPIGDDAQRALL